MNSYRLHARRAPRAAANPMGYAIRRLSSILVVAGAIVGTAAVILLERFGIPVPVALAIGFLLFAAAATFATTSVAARGSRAERTSRVPGRWLRGWSEASQWGPDPEQVIGRKTGARI